MTERLKCSNLGRGLTLLNYIVESMKRKCLRAIKAGITANDVQEFKTN